MIRIISTLLLMLGCTLPALATVKSTQAYKPIVVKANHPEFKLTLHSGRKQGYQWFVKDYNPKIIRILPVHHQIKNTRAQVVWRFRVVPEAFKAQHLSHIELVYTKPWDLRNAKYYKFTVITQANA